MEPRPPIAKRPVVIKPFEAVPPGLFRPRVEKPASILPFVTTLGCVVVAIAGWAIYAAAIVVDPRILWLVGLLLFWIAGSVGVARSAKRKGRDAVAFFVLSLLFSWFLMALIVSRMRTRRLVTARRSHRAP